MNLAPFALALVGAFTLTACHDDDSYSGRRHYGYSNQRYYDRGYSRPSTTVVVARSPGYYGPRYGHGGSSYRRNTTVVNNNTVVRNTTVKRNNQVVVVNKKKKKNHDRD
jgi:hypothetical protein